MIQSIKNKVLFDKMPKVQRKSHQQVEYLVSSPTLNQILSSLLLVLLSETMTINHKRGSGRICGTNVERTNLLLVF